MASWGPGRQKLYIETKVAVKVKMAVVAMTVVVVRAGAIQVVVMAVALTFEVWAFQILRSLEANANVYKNNCSFDTGMFIKRTSNL
mmetsp:Transcript_4756/g.8955  ORF Transcript_4756/g.8955 Transcript_4756/m.8955 type:complete len:86 (+) Transcript_4756:563-820(+)